MCHIEALAPLRPTAVPRQNWQGSRADCSRSAVLSPSSLPYTEPVRSAQGCPQPGLTPRGYVPEALSSCWWIRVSGAALGQDGWLWRALWSGGCWSQSGDLVPGGESGGHLVSVLGCGESVVAGSEVR
jgi:hypothetical protein